MKYNFSVVIEQDKDGFFASYPNLQGCYSQGETYEEAVENIRDVLSLHKEFCESYKIHLDLKVNGPRALTHVCGSGK